MAADSDFVLDAVVGFLTSPIWSTPVLCFMEQKCLVFDPDGKNYDAYVELHKNYKEMVDSLLSSFVKDVGITEEQFAVACKSRADNPTFNQIHRNIFEQIWAAEDYEIFKRIMIQKNIEIQLQALRLLEHQGKIAKGEVPNVAPPPSAPAAMDEDAIMNEVLRRSKEEYEAQVKGKLSDSALGQAVEESKKGNESKSLTVALEEAENALEVRLLAIAKREQEEMERAVKESIRVEKEKRKAEKAAEAAAVGSSPAAKTPSSASSPSSATAATTAGKPVAAAAKDLPEVRKPATASSPAPSQPAAATPSDAAASWLSSAKAEAASESTGSSGSQGAKMSDEELKRRTEYLKQQRDKLLALKQQERNKHLAVYTEQDAKGRARPTSARAARRVTDGERPESTSSDSSDQEKKLAMRRALADVLKREVIEK
ncbi:cilia- and flagella-associated protein 36 isoform X1 [Nematostella vectensis]|uniref:cilia- and flagella-associated protein 36 isoform X1 n=1 Tax=Nematostella vectensis TaxID=45351 RepID=UPI0013905453|nr:cilia- and flagella-associated protein 36 isoform X1 [Nematostella vectensis]